MGGIALGAISAGKKRMSKKGRRRGKTLEKYVAKMFGGERLGLLNKEDVRLEHFSCECKERERLPVSIKKWYAQATKHAGERIPMVYMHELNRPHGEDLVIIRAEDIKGWILSREMMK